MKTLNLENLSVQELDAKEMKEIDGGGWREWLLQFIVEKAIENWDDVQGTSNAIRASYKKHPQALLK